MLLRTSSQLPAPTQQAHSLGGLFIFLGGHAPAHLVLAAASVHHQLVTPGIVSARELKASNRLSPLLPIASNLPYQQALSPSSTDFLGLSLMVDLTC